MTNHVMSSSSLLPPIPLLLGGDMSPLMLDIEQIDAEHNRHHFQDDDHHHMMDMYQRGSINIGGFEIRRTGQ